MPFTPISVASLLKPLQSYHFISLRCFDSNFVGLPYLPLQLVLRSSPFLPTAHLALTCPPPHIHPLQTQSLSAKWSYINCASLRAVRKATEHTRINFPFHSKFIAGKTIFSGTE